MAQVLKDFSLDGKCAVVVGADSAVGRVAAQALAEAGAKLLLASQSPGADAKLNDARKAVEGAGSRAIVRSQNAQNRADLSATMNAALKDLGRLDIVVNAIDSPYFAAADASDDAAFDRVIDANLKAVWRSCQETGRVMLAHGGGVIVNVTSIFAERGVPNATLYCAAKAAVLNLTRAFALEWARRGIRVNAIEVGWSDEDGGPAARKDEFGKTLLKYLPFNRLVKPEDIGGALLYLVSPSAGFVTGESIAVDGGVLARV
ncbi:MAG: SDR family NAD(P)-dependent oxidoreductase [Candidatus Binataceae bacterium]